MSWLEAVFLRRKPTAADHPEGKLGAVTIARDTSWAATPTGLFATLGHKTYAAQQETATLAADPSVPPLPRRVSTWTTQFADVVAVGDEVALTLSEHPDARAVIIETAADGRPVVECSHCRASVTVEDFNLAMLIRRVRPSGVC